MADFNFDISISQYELDELRARINNELVAAQLTLSNVTKLIEADEGSDDTIMTAVVTAGQKMRDSWKAMKEQFEKATEKISEVLKGYYDAANQRAEKFTNMKTGN